MPSSPNTDDSLEIRRRLRRGQAVTLTILIIGYAGYYLCRSNLSVVTPLLLDELTADGMDAGEAKVRLGLMVSLGTLIYAVGKFISGAVGDFLGGRRNFLGGMAGAVLFTALFPLGGGFPLFTLAWMSNRLAQSFGWTGLVKVSSRWFGYTSYGTVMGVLSLSYLAGDAASRTFLGVLLGWGIGWRDVFWTCAAILAGLLLLSAVLLRESPAAIGAAEGDVNPLNVYGTSGHQVRPESLAGLLAPLLRNRAFWCVCLLSLSMTLLRETFNNWLPTYFQEVANLTPGSAAKQSAWFPLLGTVSVFLAGFLSDRLGRTGRATIILVSLMLTGGALWGLGQLPSGCRPGWPIVLVTLIGFLLIGPYAYMGGAIALDFGGKRGSATACGIIDGIGYLGGALGGAGFAGLLRSWDWSDSFTILALLSWLSCAAAVLLRREQSSPTREEEQR